MSVWDSLTASRTAAGLAAQMGSGEVPHAWLLLGPRGSGKRPVALAMAASLNCTDEPGVGCGTCSTCSRILRARHPDVHHIQPEGPLIPVAVIRESVIPEAALSPFEGKRKLFIIEEAERMNAAAQNALLKTLEEPNPDTVFILISDREEELLDTVRSRCRVVRMELLSHDDLVGTLILEGAHPEAAELAARVSGGDLDQARALASDAAARDLRAVWLRIPGRLTSPVDSLDVAGEVLAQVKQLVKAHEQIQKAEVIELAEAMGEGRGTATARNALLTRHKRELRRVEEETLGEALATIASFYRDVLALRAGGEEAVLNTDLMDELHSWASSDVPSALLVRAVERALETRTALGTTNTNPLLALEAALVTLGRIAPARADAVGR